MQLSSSTVLQNAKSLSDQGNYVAAYQMVLDDLTAHNTNLSAADQDVLTWLQTAIQINRGDDTPAAVAVRANNMAALQIDKGISITLFGAEQQAASNAVAKAFFAGISQNGTVQTMDQIAQLDATNGLRNLGLTDIADWAGAVPTGYSFLTGLSTNTYYNGLSSTQQQKADLLHVISAEIVADYEYSKNIGLSGNALNAEISSITADMTSPSVSPLLNGIQYSVYSAGGVVLNNMQSLWSAITSYYGAGNATNLTALQASLNTLNGTNATGANSLSVAPGVVLTANSATNSVLTSDTNGDGIIDNTQNITYSNTGLISDFVSGLGAIIGLSNATVTFAANAVGTIFGTGDTVGFSSGTAALSTATASIFGTTERLVFGSTGSVYLGAGASALFTGSDGVMTAFNNAASSLFQNTLNWNAGGSQEQLFNTDPNAGITSTYKNFSGANLSGDHLSSDITLFDGSKLRDVFSSGQNGLPTLGTEYQVGTNGSLSNPMNIWDAPSSALAVSSDPALQNFKTAFNNAIGLDAVTTPLSNSLIPTLKVGQLGTSGSGMDTAESSNTVAGGLVISDADITVTDPNINLDGLFNNSPGGILSGYYRPGAQALLQPTASLTSLLGYSRNGDKVTVTYVAPVADVAIGSTKLTNVDPLLIDLTGNGIQLTNWINNTTYFDTNVVANGLADGKQHHTSWVKAGTGILAIDRNGDGKINDITETLSQFFLGGPTPGAYKDGLDALKALAQTGATSFNATTSLIDPSTGVSYFNEIKVWQDTNLNGTTDAGELQTLTQLGITSISLVGSGNTGESIAGSAVTNRTTYTSVVNGVTQTRQIAAVNFQTNSTGDVMVNADGGVVINSTSEGGLTTTNSFVDQNATAHNFTINNGTLTDTTNSTTVGTGMVGVFASNQNDNITVNATDTTSYWLGGGTGKATLTGGAGNTVFLINSQTVVHGGTGFNIAQVTDSHAINVDLKTDNLQEVIGGAGGGTFNASGTSWNVFIQGGSGNNIIIGGAANDALAGGTGNDLIEAGTGGSVIHAGSGTDVIYGGSGSTTSAMPVNINAGANTNAGYIERMYNGVLGREEAASELAQSLGWLNSGSYNHTSYAQIMLGVPEGQAKYGSLNNSQFVTSIFQNLLGRAPSSAELTSFVNALNSGQARNVALQTIADSAEALTYWNSVHTGASDIIYGGAGQNTVVLGTNNSEVIAGTGNMTVIGNTNGFSVVRFHGSYGEYTITHNADSSVTVTDKVAKRDGAVTLKNVTDYDFADINQIPVNSSNSMPVDDTIRLTGNGPYVISASSLMANDLNYSGGAISISNLIDNNGNLINKGASGQVNGGIAALSTDGSTVTFTPVANFSGIYSFRYNVTNGLTVQTVNANGTPTGASAAMSATVSLVTSNQPTDSGFTKEWYLQAADVLPAWQAGYTGAGVSVGIFDLGNVDFTNSDLAPNAAGIFKGDGTPGVQQVTTHATYVAGIIGAANDGVGQVGVAYNARLSSETVGITESQTDNTGLRDWSKYDVVNNSWGDSPPYADSFTHDTATATDFANAASAGRGGLGTVIVFGGGNARTSGGNTEQTSVTANQYEITVGGINAPDDLGALHVSGTPFSNPGASILVSAPANNIKTTGSILTNDYGQQFGGSTATVAGTSLSAPIVSGITAMMLQANPNLGARDVQDILADTAQFVPDSNTSWTYNKATGWNGGGMHESYDYGFGEVDAAAAVRLAKSWTLNETFNNEQVFSFIQQPNMVIPNAGGTNIPYIDFNSPLAGTVQHIEVTLKIAFPNLAAPASETTAQQTQQVAAANALINGLTVTLTSNNGASSTLMQPIANSGGAVLTYSTDRTQIIPVFNYTFDTVRNWNESDSQDFHVTVTNPAGSSAGGVIQGATLNIYGNGSDVTGNAHIYTNEFGALSSDPNNTARSTLSDSSGNVTLNAAAVSINSTFDLVAGSTDSNIAGRALNIASGTIIQTLYVGSGNNTIKGNTANDTIGIVGQGADTITATNATINSINGNTITITGQNDSITMSGGIVNSTANTGFVVTGSQNTITAAGGDVITLSSTGIGGNNLSAANGDTITFYGNGSKVAGGIVDNINVTSGTVHVTDGAGINLRGTGDTVTLGNNAALTSFYGTATITGGTNDAVYFGLGGGNNVTLGNGGQVWVSDNGQNGTNGGSDILNMSSGQVNFFVDTGSGITGANATINGNNNVITAVASDNMSVNGGGNTINAVAGDTVSILGNGQTGATGGVDNVNISGGGVVIQANADAILTGNNNSVTVNATDTLTIAATSASNTITVSGNSSIIADNGASDAVTLNGNNDSDTLTGNADTVSVNGANDSITLNGTSEIGTLQSASSATTVIVGGTGNKADDHGTGNSTIIINGSSATGITYGRSSSITANGTGAYIELDGTLETGTLNGTGNTVELLGTSNTFNDMQSAGSNSLNLLGSNNSATAHGTGSSITAWNGTGHHATLAGNSETLTIYSASSSDIVSVTGNNDTITDNGTNNSFSLSGTGITLTVKGTGDTITDSGSGANIFNGGGGSSLGSATFNGGTGYETYKFATNFGQDVINNNGGSTANGEVDFTFTATNQNFWFKQVGNHLQIIFMGTTQTVTINNWFSNPGAQVKNIVLSDGTKLANTNVASLVTAMANYSATNPSFNPASISQAPGDSTLQAAINTAWNQKTNFTDTAANIAAQLDSLQALAASNKLGTITITNPATPLSITNAQLTNDAGALAAIVTSYSLAVSGVTAANATTVSVKAHVTSIGVSDTAANVKTNIAALQTLASGGKLSAIAFTDSGTPALSFTAAQAASDTAAINLFTGAFTLTVSDTAANVVSNLSALQTLAAASKLTSIALTDAATPTLSITDAQRTGNSAALAKITSAYNLTLSAVTAANATTVSGLTHVTSISVSDTAANVAANIAALQALSTKLTAITLTDSGTPTLSITDAQRTADAAALAKITGSYNLAVSAVTAANATSVSTQPHVTSVSVTDSSANVLTNIVALQALAAKLATITLTDAGTPTLSVTSAQFTADVATLNKIVTPYNLTVTGATAANVATIAAQSHVTSITVTDTGANIATSLDSMQSVASKVTSVTVSNGGTAIAITSTQFTNDAAIIAKFTGTYSFIVSGVLAASATNVSTQPHVTSLTVADSAANVGLNISALGPVANTGKLTSIVFTDSGTPTMTITDAQRTGNSSALNKITGTYNLAITAVLASNATSAAGAAHVTSISVLDTSANVLANVTGLQTQAAAGKLTAIVLTDSTTPTLSLTATQAINDATAFSKITSTYKEVIAADANKTETLAATGNNNTISFANETQGVTANLASGTATTVRTGTTYTYTLSNFQNVTGTTFVDTLTARSAGGVLTGNGGADTFVLNAAGIDVAKDTSAHLNGTTIQNFSTLDGIDLTDMVFSSHPTLGFTENGGNTAGTLTISDGTHTATLQLLGQYAASSFQTVSDGGTGTLVAMASTPNLTAILATAHG